MTDAWIPSVVTRPIEGESRRGYLIRACERNGWPSLWSFLRPTGIKPSVFERGEDPDHLAKSFGMLPGWWDSFSEEHTKRTVEIRGQSIPASRLRRSNRLVCQECLTESRHQRIWWDLDYFSSCPHHGIALTSKCRCGKPLSWNDTAIDLCLDCSGVVCHLSKAEPEIVRSPFESYLLGRLGFSHGERCDLLDTLPINTAIEFVEDVAALMASGFSAARPAIEKYVDASVRRDEAFQIIRQGKMASVVAEVVATYYEVSGALTPSSPRATLGWFGTVYDRYGEFENVDQILRSALSEAIGFPVYILDVCEFAHVETIAFKLGLTSTEVTKRAMTGRHRHNLYRSGNNLFVPIDLASAFDGGSWKQ